MKTMDEILDTETMSEILATLYNRRLQQILCYKDSRFTKELTDHLFVSFEELTHKDYAGNYFAEDVKKSFSQLLKGGKGQDSIDGNMLFISSLLEIYAKNIVEKYCQSDCPEDMEHYRKKVTYQFSLELQNPADAFPQSLKPQRIIPHIRQAVARRNNFVHQKGRTHTTRYSGYLYLCGYDLLLGYLLYAFYHMVFAKVERKYYLSEKPEPLPHYESFYHLWDDRPTFIPEAMEALQIQREWDYLQHIYADYLLQPIASFIFGPFASYPKYKWEKPYQRVTDELKGITKELKELSDNVLKDILRRKELAEIEKSTKEKQSFIANAWSKTWCNRLLNFFVLRLCQSKKLLDEHLLRQEKYGILLLRILKVNDYPSPPHDITLQLIEMMGDYLYRNTPVTPSDTHPLSCLVTARKNYVETCSGKEGYIDFEKKLYTKKLMDQMEELAELYPKRLKKHPMTCHFLSLSEYLMVLSIYAYMTEAQIRQFHLSHHLPSLDFITYMQALEFQPIP